MSKNVSTTPIITMEVDQKSLLKMQTALKKYPQECAKGTVSAINKALKTTDTAMQKAITTRYNINKKALNGGDTFKSDSSNNLIKEHKAVGTNLNASIIVRGKRLALVADRHMILPTNPKSQKGKTKAKISKTASPKVKIIKGHTVSYPHAFLMRVRGRTVGLFTRNDTGGLVMQHTVSPANMVREKSVAAATQKAAAAALNRYAEHEISYRLEKVSK